MESIKNKTSSNIGPFHKKLEHNVIIPEFYTFKFIIFLNVFSEGYVYIFLFEKNYLFLLSCFFFKFNNTWIKKYMRLTFFS